MKNNMLCVYKKIKVSGLVFAVSVLLFLTMFVGVSSVHAEETDTQSVQSEETPQGNISSDGRILPNVYVGSINVGGMTLDEAKNACASYVDSVNASAVTFTCKDKSVIVPLSDIGVSTDAGKVVEAAYSYGRKGNVLKRYKETKELENGGTKELELNFSLSGDAYTNLENVFAGFNVEPSSASIEMVDGSFQIQPESVGIAVDSQASIEQFQNVINQTTDFGSVSMELVYTESEPEVTSDALNGITDKLGEYTTTYSGDAGRMANVENACNFINGTLVLPGEEFDTDATIRPYTEENGYHYAAEYSNGQVVQGLGGGVCQVSTTLYNAVLYAELEVTQRANHSLTVGYVKLAQDAAISGDVKNFKFRNNTDTPIYIAGACENGQITFALFGKETRPENRTLEFESVLVETISPGEAIVDVDNSLPVGTRNVTQKAHTGYVAELWKHVYVDGQLTDSIKINTSQYMSTPEHVTVGPDAPEEVSENPDETPSEVPVDAPAETPVDTPAVPAEAPADPAPAEDPPADAPME
ncbi:MAG: VanW family protein [Lachnospiraceae bacterium]|nr:VanW family protein [Lachnospiraceae bacterium]MBQ9232735.1 VanW family protein [Lachnospiraceae bacterium]